MTTNAPATGRCNCGAVTLTLEDGFPDSTILCHCTNCRRSSGSLFSAIMFVPPHAVSTAGGEHVKQYADKHTDSGGTLLRHFCGFCGSSLYSMLQGVPESLVVRAGLFDPHSLPPLSVEVFTRNLERFERVHPGVVSFEGMPPQPTSSASEAVQARM